MPAQDNVRIAPADGKLGVLIPGMGAVTTTFIAGLEAVKRGLAKPIGSLTQLSTIRLGKRTEGRTPLIKDLVPLTPLEDLVIGAWDIFQENAYEAAQLAGVLDTVVAEIKQIWADARKKGADIKRPAWPMIVFRTPKGWTCPAEIDGKKCEDYWRSHQVPMGDMDKPDHIRILEGWMKSYRPEELFDGQGREITAEIIDLNSEEINLRKLHEAETLPLRCRIILGQAIPKGKNMELIVQKAVEIGAAEIVPIISDRTIVQVDSESAAQKQTKWQQIAIEAGKQCGQNWLPYVHMPRKLSELFSAAAEESFDLRLIGSLQPDAQHLKKILAGYSNENQHRPRSVLMLVGPEGDFTPAELALETASIYCLSILSYELLI